MSESSQCCGCTSYKNGLTALGAFTLTFSLLSIISGSIVVADCNSYSYHCNNYNGWESCDNDDNYSTCIYYGSTTLVGGILAFIASGVLLYGVFKARTAFVIPYYVLMVFDSVSYSILSVYLFIYGYIGVGFLFIAIGMLYMYFAYVTIMYRRYMLLRSIQNAPFVVAAPVYPAMGSPYPGIQVVPTHSRIYVNQPGTAYVSQPGVYVNQGPVGYQGPSPSGGVDSQQYPAPPPAYQANDPYHLPPKY